MNADREDVGVLLRHGLDLSFGANENNFECTIHKNDHCCEAGYYLYMDGTEYGGIIDAVKSDTATGDITYSGRTWHGMLESKILEPDAGQDYLVLSGEANAVIGTLLQRIGLDDLFSACASDSSISISSYQMNRYIGAYSGIVKMLKSANAKLKFTFADGKVVLSAAPVVDYTQEGLYADTIDFVAKKTKGKVNHLICLGKGELAERTVVHLYADADGNISQTKTFSGVDEFTEIYDYSSVETVEELIKSGTDKLKELRQQDSLSVSFNNTANEFDIGDIVGAYDNATGVSVAVAITQKIVTISNGRTSVSYSTDKENTTYSSGASSGETGQQGDMSDFLSQAYPVGAIYISAVSTSPAELFGGTWKQLEGRFLLGCSPDYACGSTGGAAEVTLTQDQIPSHKHSFQRAPYLTREMSGSGVVYAEQSTTAGKFVDATTSKVGGGKAHDNMPPYLAMYMWQRTA